MQADIDGAVQIVRLAAGFDWTWTLGNLDDFCSAAGWREQRRSRRGATFHSGLNLERDRAEVQFNRKFLATHRAGLDVEVSEARVLVSDFADVEDLYSQEDMVDLFAELHSSIVAVLGPVSQRAISGRPGLVWNLSNLVLVLDADGCIAMNLTHPIYREWRDKSVSASENGDIPVEDESISILPRPSTWPEFDKALALTVALMPEDTALSISVPSAYNVTFLMDEFHADCIIRPKSGDDSAFPVSAELRATLTEQRWVERVDNHGSYWNRSVEWPSPMRDYRELAESAMGIVQSLFGGVSPVDLQIEAWTVRGENIPNISFLAP